MLTCLMGGWPAARSAIRWKQYKYRRRRPISISRFHQRMKIALLGNILILLWLSYCWANQMPRTMAATGTTPSCFKRRGFVLFKKICYNHFRMKRSLIYLKILQIVVDGLLILAAFALAYFIRISFGLTLDFPFIEWNGYWFSGDFPFGPYFLIGVITMPITLLFMFFIRAYKLSQRILSWRHVQRLTFVAVENVFIFMILYYFTFRIFFSRLMLVYVFALTLVLTYAWHLTFRWILQKMSEREVGVYRTLIIGANRPSQEIIRLLITEKSHLKPVAVIDAYGGKKTMIHGIPVVGKMNKFEKTIADHDIDVILQVDNLEQTLNIINYALANNIKYIMPPELLGVFQGHQMIEEVEGVPFLKLHRNKKWWHSIW